MVHSYIFYIIMYIFTIRQNAQKYNEKFSHPSTPEPIDKGQELCYNNKAVERKRTEVTEEK